MDEIFSTKVQFRQLNELLRSCDGVFFLRVDWHLETLRLLSIEAVVVYKQLAVRKKERWKEEKEKSKT